MKNKKIKPKIILLLIILIGAFLRFYKLDWGEGFFFHPDENNIAAAISRLKPPQFHPQFFAYGHFSIYLVYFFHQFLNLVKNQAFLAQIPFPQAIYTLRFLSALESVFVIFIVFLIGKKIFDSKRGLIAAALVSFTPGLIQAAHFGTTESLLTLVLFSALYLSLRLMEKNPPKKVFWFLGIILGIGLSTKINSLIFLSFPVLGLLLKQNFSPRKIWSQKKLFFLLFFSFTLVFLISFITSPYQILDFAKFRGTAQYEIDVAWGKSPVFYTRQFNDTQPIIFQLTRIFPFSLNPFLEIAGLTGFFFILIKAVLKKTEKQALKKRILLAFALLIYLPASFFTFTKWTRFTTPLLPFFALFSLEIIPPLTKSKVKLIGKSIIIFLTSISFLSSLAFFTIYVRPDIRITASGWMAKNLPPQSLILSEAGNVVNIPLKGNFRAVNFGFYNLEENPDLFEELLIELEKNEYLLVPSRRIFANHPFNSYPKTACYHQLLFSNRLGFKKIKEFSSYPSLKIGNCLPRTEWCWGKLEIPDEAGEETWSVFDHPVIRLYQKTTFYSKEKYNQLFKQCLDNIL